MPGGPRGLRAAAGRSGEQRPCIPSVYQHSGHLGCWLPCRAAVFASAGCQGALSWTRGLQRPSSEAGDPSLGNRDGGTAPLSSHLWQLSCEMRGPSAVVRGPEPGACLAGQTRRLAGAPALAGQMCPVASLRKGAWRKTTASGWSVISELRQLSVQSPARPRPCWTTLVSY